MPGVRSNSVGDKPRKQPVEVEKEEEGSLDVSGDQVARIRYVQNTTDDELNQENPMSCQQKLRNLSWSRGAFTS